MFGKDLKKKSLEQLMKTDILNVYKKENNVE